MTASTKDSTRHEKASYMTEEGMQAFFAGLRGLISKPKYKPSVKDAVTRGRLLVSKALELGYDFKDIARVLTATSGVTVAVGSLRKYYKAVSEQPVTEGDHLEPLEGATTVLDDPSRKTVTDPSPRKRKSKGEITNTSTKTVGEAAADPSETGVTLEDAQKSATTIKPVESNATSSTLTQDNKTLDDNCEQSELTELPVSLDNSNLSEDELDDSDATDSEPIESIVDAELVNSTATEPNENTADNKSVTPIADDEPEEEEETEEERRQRINAIAFGRSYVKGAVPAASQVVVGKFRDISRQVRSLNAPEL